MIITDKISHIKSIRLKVMSEQELIIELDQQPIELYKLLKIADLVSGGGEAKVVISEGYVFLNGEVEYQKRKKIYHQDIIEFNGTLLHIQVNENLAFEQEINEKVEVEPAPFKQTKTKAKSENKQNKHSNATEGGNANTGRKRRPISF